MEENRLQVCEDLFRKDYHLSKMEENRLQVCEDLFRKDYHISKMEENRLQMDDVCIEEDEAVIEMREIYKAMDHIKTKVGYSLEDTIKKICSTENMPQNIRRSERIQVKLIQKEYDRASHLTYKPTMNETTSQKKSRASSKKKRKSLGFNEAPISLVGQTSQSSNKKHSAARPERIEGIVYKNGMEYVAVKWKGKKPVELVLMKNLTDNLRKLTMSFLHSNLRMLSGNENASQEDHASLVTVSQERKECLPMVENSAFQENEKQTLCENNDYYPVSQVDEWDISSNCTVKTTNCIDVSSLHLQEDSAFQENEKQTCENNDYYPVSQVDEWDISSNCTVKNTNCFDVSSLHLQNSNFLSFRRKQREWMQENGINTDCSVDVKMPISYLLSVTHNA